MNCTTKSACSLVLGGSTADRDAGDYVAAYTISVSGNLTSFAYNASTGLINFTPAKTEIGNYTLNITISDTHGATNSTSVALIINNTPEAPNLTRYGFGAETIVETHLFAYELWATDDDLLISVGENVTFTTNLTLAHTITPLASANNTAKALLTFTPDIGTAGRYSVRINATDRFGLVGSRVVDFVVYPKVPPPNITSITPWGLGALTHDLQTSYISTDNVIFGGGRVAQVNLGENTTVLFNLVVNDTRPVTYSWTVNGTQVSTSSSYSREFDFFSAGRYTVSILVANDRLENSSWTWDLTVTDVNRPPVLKNNLTSPLSANGTVVYATYFTLNNGTKFIDPDDDLNSNGIIDGDEASTLTFSANSACSAATLSAVGSDLKIAGVTIGSCAVTFNATDAHGATAESNLVGINVTGVPTGESPAPTVTSTGGGGSSSTTSTFIPLNKKVDTPKAFSIIAPKLVTVYSNKSVTIPITINNTWNAPLKMLRLTAQTNASGVRTAFDTDFFEEIGVNQSKEVTLTVTNYRLGSNYEILVKANVSDPKYEDQALVLLNSIEQAQDGSDVSVKVTFANDLLNEHPECQELNEVLSEAKKKIADGNLKEGEQLVTSVIDGCKYLVSTQQRIQEKPTRLNPIININDLSVKAIMLGVLAFVVLSSIAFLIYYHYTHKPEDDI
jgi:hypothetical protein